MKTFVGLEGRGEFVFEPIIIPGLLRTSADAGTCVEVATVPDGRIAVRNSNRPADGVVLFTRAEMNAWINGVKAGEFDDLA